MSRKTVHLSPGEIVVSAGTSRLLAKAIVVMHCDVGRWGVVQLTGDQLRVDFYVHGYASSLALATTIAQEIAAGRATGDAGGRLTR